MSPLRTLMAANLLFACFYTPHSVAQQCGPHHIYTPPCREQSDPGVAQVVEAAQHFVGNPVDTITGNKYQSETDFKSLGSELQFTRYYNSYQSEVNAGLGHGWRHSFNVHLVRGPENVLTVVQADGRQIDFTYQANEASTALYVPHNATDGVLIERENPVWYLPDGRRLHFTGSFLREIAYPNGNSLQLHYRQFRLDHVSDSFGRQLTFEYSKPRAALRKYGASEEHIDRPGHLRAIVLPGGERVEYRYDTKNNLTQTSFAYHPKRVYSYTNSHFPHYLTQVSSDEAQALKTWQYDEQGRAVHYTNEAKREDIQFDYVGHHLVDTAGQTHVRFRGGINKIYHWKEAPENSAAYVHQIDTQECSDCSWQTENYEHATKAAEQNSLSLLKQAEQWVQRREVYSVPDKLTTGLSARELIKKALEHDRQAYFDKALAILVNGYEPSVHALGGVIREHQSGFANAFEVIADKDGQIAQISIAGLSYIGLRNNWVLGNLVNCGETTIANDSFARSDGVNADPNTCFENFVFLAELMSQLQKKNAKINREILIEKRDGSTEKSEGQRRAKPKSVVDTGSPCKRNPFTSCQELYRNFELALLSQCAYQAITQYCGLNWNVVNMSSFGIAASEFQDADFSATLFYNPFKREYVLSFRGTDGIGDVPTNAGQALGSPVPQYQKAVALADRVNAIVGDNRLHFTGHSLGGGLATAAAAKVHQAATVFNPAALHPWTAKKLGIDYSFAQRWVNVTTMDDDIVTDAQKPTLVPFVPLVLPVFPAPGHHTTLPKPDNNWVEEQKEHFPMGLPKEKLAMHSISTTLKSVEEILIKQCKLTPSRDKR